MTLQQTLAMLLERGNAMQSFWGFYISITLGLLAFFGSLQRPIRLAVLVSIAFIAFATVNASGMLDIAEQREALWNQIAQFNGSMKPDGSALSEGELAAALADVVKPPASKGIRVFHVCSDIAVLLAIWFLTLRRKDAAKLTTVNGPSVA
jgi:hypothetical protein